MILSILATCFLFLAAPALSAQQDGSTWRCIDPDGCVVHKCGPPCADQDVPTGHVRTFDETTSFSPPGDSWGWEEVTVLELSAYGLTFTEYTCGKAAGCWANYVNDQGQNRSKYFQQGKKCQSPPFTNADWAGKGWYVAFE